MSRILGNDAHAHKSQEPDPFTASDELLADESYVAWLDEVRQAREEEDRDAMDRWLDSIEANVLREIEEEEREGNDFGYDLGGEG